MFSTPLEILCLSSLFVGCLVAVEISSAPRMRLSSSEKECPGTARGFGYSGNKQFHYDTLRLRLQGCTYIMGNLEITNFDDANVTYDLSFLSDIRVVTGYVLIAMVTVDTIPLTSLELILGEQTYTLKRKFYSLIVVLNDIVPAEGESGEMLGGLRELQMPNLQEISNGRVMFFKNPQLCHVQTIDWKVLKPGDKEEVDYFMSAQASLGQESTCPPCHSNCERNGVARCWGEGRNMCQKLVDIPDCREDDDQCLGRCYDNHFKGCCHSHCAVGCFGPRDSDCKMCKFFKYTDITGRQRCVDTCPIGTYSLGQDCVYNPMHYRVYDKK